MALKLTRTATEILGDILLNTLQQNGLEKAEALEQSFFDAFIQLGNTTDQGMGDGKFITVDDYAVIYKNQETAITILTIIHISRLPQTFKA